MDGFGDPLRMEPMYFDTHPKFAVRSRGCGIVGYLGFFARLPGSQPLRILAGVSTWSLPTPTLEALFASMTSWLNHTVRGGYEWTRAVASKNDPAALLHLRVDGSDWEDLESGILTRYRCCIWKRIAGTSEQ